MRRILLVEDHFADAFLLTECLEAEDAGWEVTHAETFAQAARCWEEGPFDALLLDLDLPDGFGMELLGRALALAGSAPVVVLSGLADAAVASEARRRGARAYVVKGVAAVPALTAALRPGETPGEG